MTEKPRTWTLTRWNNGLYDDYDIAEGPTKLAEEGQVQVIELEPVLDLLEKLDAAIWPYIENAAPHEQLFNGLDYSNFQQLMIAREAAEALLHEHGRLK